MSGPGNPRWLAVPGLTGGGHPRQGGITIHRGVAQTALGRPLRRDEIVHHINGEKTDNRNHNLLICARSYHLWLHQRMSYLYQQEHFGGA